MPEVSIQRVGLKNYWFFFSNIEYIILTFSIIYRFHGIQTLKLDHGLHQEVL